MQSYDGRMNITRGNETVVAHSKATDGRGKGGGINGWDLATYFFLRLKSNLQFQVQLVLASHQAETDGNEGGLGEGAIRFSSC